MEQSESEIRQEMRELRQELALRRQGLDGSQPNLRDYGLDKRALYEFHLREWHAMTARLEARYQELGALSLKNRGLPCNV